MRVPIASDRSERRDAICRKMRFISIVEKKKKYELLLSAQLLFPRSTVKEGTSRIIESKIGEISRRKSFTSRSLVANLPFNELRIGTSLHGV